MAEPKYLRLFVYGTLKRGYCYHDSFCASAKRIEPAYLYGRLYHLKEGYPALQLPREHMGAVGSSDPLSDVERQVASDRGLALEHPPGDWDIVHGELMTFEDPTRALPPIDQLEDFYPNGKSLYKRVLVSVNAQQQWVACWTYYGLDALFAGSVRIKGGCWGEA